jgi:sugar lactone lactonase YvrE
VKLSYRRTEDQMSPVSPEASDGTQILLEDLVVGESPRWHDGRLWCSNWGAGQILAVDPSGRSDVMVELPESTLPFCFDWLPDGALLVVDGPHARLMRLEPDGSSATHADLSGLSSYPWNEIVVDGRGNAYLNSICFDMMAGGEFQPGIIALLSSDGELRQVAEDVAFPNGMVITPDGRTLIVSESYAARLTAFDIAADGDLCNRRVWAQLEDPPDGISLDADGAVWAAAMNRCVRVAEGGEILQSVTLDRSCFACMLGGEAEPTLFIMAAEWNGPEGMTARRTGRIVTMHAPSPRAGSPG